MKTITLRSVALAILALAVVTTVALAQESAGLPGASRAGQQSLRPYWHVFAAYTIVILLIGGWAFSIARRLKDVERRLVD